MQVNASLSNKVNGINVSGDANIYVSKSGNDSTGGLEKNNPFLTIDAAVAYAKKLRSENATIIWIDDGTYVESNIVAHEFFSPLFILSINNDPAKVKIICPANTYGIYVRTGYCWIRGISLDVTPQQDMSAIFFDRGRGYVQNCILNISAGTGITNFGVQANNSNVKVAGTQINNAKIAIFGNAAFIVCMQMSGSGNSIGVQATGGLITHDGTIPATTAKSESLGGFIRP